MSGFAILLIFMPKAGGKYVAHRFSPNPLHRSESVGLGSLVVQIIHQGYYQDCQQHGKIVSETPAKHSSIQERVKKHISFSKQIP